MAEPLKNSFGPEVIDRISDDIVAVHPGFPADEFVRLARAGYLELELTPRARQIASVLAATLPFDRREALRLLQASLGPTLGDQESDGMASFVYLPHVFFVAEHGLENFEEAMAFQYEVTRRFTAEFSVRAFLDHHTDRTLERLRDWATDPDMHVRRLVSEGTRPRLPWAPRLQRFVREPGPVLELLELLKDDPAEYVRRSVANNLNDISKDHPGLVTDVAERWSDRPERRRLLRHALRTLIKAGDRKALAVLGYVGRDGIEVQSLSVEPERVRLGEKVAIEAVISNTSTTPSPALVDLTVHFVKKAGASSPKVFKGKEAVVEPGSRVKVRKTVSLAHQTTRTPYPGTHVVEVMVNGEAAADGRFEVLDP